MRAPLTYEVIVKQEVRRIGVVPGFDHDDLAQEARVAIMLAMKRVDQTRGEGAAATYVRTAARNALINAKRNATTNGRLPHDAYGRRMWKNGVVSLSTPVSESEDVTMLDTLSGDEQDPEEGASARELVRALDAGLSRYEMGMLVAALVSGAQLTRARALGRRTRGDIEQIRMRARAILDGMLRGEAHRVDDGSPKEDDDMATKKALNVIQAPNVPDVALSDLPDCHAARGGAGFDPNDEGCGVKCPDKFTCVRTLIDNPAKNTAGVTLDTDHEVRDVLGGEMAWDSFVERYTKRTDLIEKGKAVPADLLPNAPPKKAKPAKAAPEPAKEPEPETANETADEGDPTNDNPENDTDTTNDDNGSASAKEDAKMTKKTTKKAAAAKTTTKAATKVAAPKPPKAAKPAAAKKTGAKRPRLDPKDRTAIVNGTRFLPQPRENTAEQMASALSRIAIGAPFALAVGMSLVRKRRDGSEVVVTIKANGFEMDGVIYSSLSGAAMHAETRSVSGNDFFNMKHSCTEVRGKGVPGGVFSGAGEGKKAGEPKAGAPKKAAAPAKAAVKPAKAAKGKAPPPPPAAKKAAKKATKKTAKK